MARIETAEGAVQVNKTRSGVTISTYDHTDVLQHFVALTDEDARAAHTLLGQVLPPSSKSEGT